MQMIQDDTDLSDESDYRKSIFNLFNHLQSSQQNETETNKTALKYTTKKEKTPTFGWSHVDDADDTDHPDRSVTDDRQTNIIEFWSPSTQKALKGNNISCMQIQQPQRKAKRHKSHNLASGPKSADAISVFCQQI